MWQKIKKHRHGMTKTRLYRIFENMISRCYRDKSRSFSYCGKKGIKICDEWLNDKTSFFDWAIKNGYSDNLTIDRIDNKKDYSPDNCRWVKRIVQDRNRTNNYFITFNGETMCKTDWERKLNFRLGLLTQRIDLLGWDINKALTTPVKKRRKINEI